MRQNKKKHDQAPQIYAHFPADIELFTLNIENTRKMCEMCSKLTTQTPEGRQRRFGVFIVDF